ncbi:hypothetical protein [Neisseria dentiae]|uniref:hypothetical protein n=1 Tax=Neisseria dentiae TaxID=194197 RepID=UPI0035A17AB5
MKVKQENLETIKHHLENLLPKPTIESNDGQNCTKYDFNNGLAVNVFGTGTITVQGPTQATNSELAKSIRKFIENYE